MDNQAQFEMKVSNLANRFLYNSLTTPQRLLPLAERIARDGQKLAKEYDEQQRIQSVAEELLKVMDGSLYLVDRLADAILTKDYQHLSEDELVDELGKIEGNSDEEERLIQLLMESIQSNLQQGITLEEIYYENYLTEYAASLMEIYVIQHLKNQEEFLNELQPLIKTNRDSEVPYGIFVRVSNNFKKELARQYYRYETVVKLMETDAH
ncbi:hypothetical protein [Enterococcus pallens]|uniref:Uncharacterized protein n=1 Tax=Enterococcus pallens ATCC BAA-351 TaxID=1158607 RepID=R2SIH2_9ENTE|nr:hypothetical protein [Enterococcus pallens]EOH87984.1 hypothetical protein UAU_04839 [Enterococcus pallens ATCC BAA-351]EOU18198.1 hypothetical protein I588_03187 [Enterococcus pallens ATCC BAA-351]OJG82181.1 hypothetical protein RV10_GL000002 [Enterococcus pallens]